MPHRLGDQCDVHPHPPYVLTVGILVMFHRYRGETGTGQEPDRGPYSGSPSAFHSSISLPYADVSP